MTDEEQLLSDLEARVRAVRAKDVDALLAFYAEELRTFDLVLPLAHQGREPVRERVVAWFASFRTPLDYEVRDVVTAVGRGDVAFQHHFTHVRGTTHSGQDVDMWFRETLGFRRSNGRWKVVHQHSSVPLDVSNGQARVDLRP